MKTRPSSVRRRTAGAALAGLAAAALLGSGATAQSAASGPADAPTPATQPEPPFVISDQAVGRAVKLRGLRVAPGVDLSQLLAPGTLLGGNPSTGISASRPKTSEPYEADGDGDLLEDLAETIGWDIVIDEHGYGPDGQAGLLTKLKVTSNPLLADSDGDGLDDYEEFIIGTNPKKVDTDGDGLTDDQEWNVLFTNPNSVDSDSDARGPQFNQPPNAFLFDSIELDPSTPRTSPLLEDTDGDGRTDFEELDHPFFSPLLSEIPTAALSIEGELDIRLDVQYEESVGGETAYETSLSSSTSSSSSLEVGSSSAVANANHWSESVSAEVEAGIPPGASVSGTLEQGGSTEVTKTTSFGVTQESAQAAEATSSQYQSDSQSFTEVSASGSITLPFRVVNDSLFSYTLTNLGITLLKFDAVSLANGGEPFKAMGTLQPDLPALTLAPGEATPILTLDSGDLDAEVVKDFLADPNTLVLEPSIFDLQDENGIDFDFITQNTYTQTALVEIDLGDGDVQSYRVATNVDRDGFEYLGIELGTVLTELGIDYTVESMVPPVTGTNAQGQMAEVRRLASVDGLAYVGTGPAVEAAWIVMPTGDTTQGFVAPDGLGGEFIDFESMRLFAGDAIRVVYTTDEDGDGFWAAEESLVGSDPLVKDTDNDGIWDGGEAKTGWTIGGSLPQSGSFVTSDPLNQDTDGDGLLDVDERTAQTDPRDPDTDGDGLADGVDPAPLTPALRLYASNAGSASNSGLSWSQARTVSTAFNLASTNNADADPANDVSEIWVAKGIYTPVQLFFPTAGEVTVYGGFDIGDTKLAQRDADPLTNQTVINGAASTATHFVEFDRAGVHDALTPSGTLDGFSIVGGTQETAVRVIGGRPTFRNVLFAQNTGTSGGALHIIADSSVQLESCIFEGNLANTGGAIREGGNASSTYRDCRFSHNEASEGGAYYATWVNVVPPLFERCVFVSNRARDPSSTSTTPKAGGAVYTDEGATFVDCDFFGNVATSDVVDFDYYGNFDARTGGAIYADVGLDQRLVLINCRLFGNSAGDGGAIFVANPSVVGTANDPAFLMINCTLALNNGLLIPNDTAPSGGLKMPVGSAGSWLRVENSVLYGNTKNGTLDPDTGTQSNNLALFGFNWLQDNIIGFAPPVDVQGFGNVGSDPQFLNLFGGNLRVAAGSPAVDSGHDAVDVDPETPGFQPLPAFDLDGNPRIVDGDGLAGATVDRGAYEVQP